MGVCSSNSGEIVASGSGFLLPRNSSECLGFVFFLTSFPKSQDAKSFLHSMTARPHPGVAQSPQFQWPCWWEL